jgi:tripartite-type tricarboxylate transporter receptor subunit TctC
MTCSMRLALAALFAVLGCAASAQDYPSRTVTIIVPYPAGGPTDQLARVLAPKFSEKLGQNFIVENVSGGGTTIATGRVARGGPDGHTLLLHNLQISANVALFPKLNFDTEKDLAPVAFINRNPLVLVGRKTLAPNTLGELVTHMKATPTKMAHPGTGSTGHLATSLFAQEAKVNVVHVPYRGAAPALQDIAGSHVDLFFATPQSVVQGVAAGQMRAYGITAKEKYAQFPNVASFVQELGPKLEIFYWHALLVPGGTPKPIVDKLNAVLQGVMDDPAIVKSWADSGVAPYPKDQRSPQAAQTLLRSEITRWGQVVRENNIQPPAQ